MKKLSIISTTLFLASSLTANASNYYGGVEVSGNRTGLKGQTEFYNKNSGSLNFFAGYKLQEGFALEGGISHSNAEKTHSDASLGVSDATSKLRLLTISGDLLKHFSVSKNSSVFALAGVSVVKGSLKEQLTYLGQDLSSNSNKTALGYSVGAGFTHRLTENLDLRAKLKFTKVGIKFSNSYGNLEVKDSTSASIGLVYNF